MFLSVLLFVNTALKSQESKIQVALLLDTSNSMDGLIDQAKTELWSVVNELSKAQQQNQAATLEIALYEYGNDNIEVADGYVKRVVNFTSDLDLISEKLFALTTNGGYEYCGHVIQNATKDLQWSKSDKDLKIIFIAGNEEFTQGNVDYKMSCKDAETNNIIINSIFCGDKEEGIRYFWKDGAELAKGTYLTIDQSKTSAYIETPYDDEMLRLSTELNKTYVAYGADAEEYSVRQETQDLNAAGSNRGAAVSRAVSKSSHVYKNSGWDLIDAVDDKIVDIDKLEKQNLPEEMKSMTNEEKLKYIETKKAERILIQKKIAENNKKREAYIAAKRIENAEDDTLGNAMKLLVREQAEKKGFLFLD